METFIFTATTISFLIQIVSTMIRPFPFQIAATNEAKKRGWSTFTILVTRTFPRLNLYTQFWILVAMYNLTATTMFIAQSISWFLFFFHHGIGIIDPTYLTYNRHQKEFIKSIVSWRPPINRNIISWFSFHFHHTFFPFYLHYLTFKYNINYTQSIFSVLCSIVAMTFYTLWHMFCWHVQGIPAYPFIEEFNYFPLTLFFSYRVGFDLLITIDCILAFMWRELFFYFLDPAALYNTRHTTAALLYFGISTSTDFVTMLVPSIRSN